MKKTAFRARRRGRKGAGSGGSGRTRGIQGLPPLNERNSYGSKKLLFHERVDTFKDFVPLHGKLLHEHAVLASHMKDVRAMPKRKGERGESRAKNMFPAPPQMAQPHHFCPPSHGIEQRLQNCGQRLGLEGTRRNKAFPAAKTFLHGHET